LYQIVAEYEDFLVVNKQPETSIHNEASGADSCSNEIGLIQQLRNDFNTQDIYPVHRLDKPTSGLLICAKTAEANSQLSQLFQYKKIEKYYLAVSHKKPKKKQGLIVGDMVRTRNGNWKLAKSINNPAITQFFSYGLGEGKRLFVLKPYTGKTHQLRVALKSIGSPIVGDQRYGSMCTEEDKGIERTHLHAYCLRFEYKSQYFHFQCLPCGDNFSSHALEYIQHHLNDPWGLPWPNLPDNLGDKKQFLKKDKASSLDLPENSEQAYLLSNEALYDAVQCIIDIANEPLSEYQLIQILKQQGWDLSTNAADSLELFTSHFLIFNALYHLQKYYWEKQERYLEISALSISLHKKVKKNTGVESKNTWLNSYTEEAALRDYYLDLSQLESATEDSVNKFLSQFWERYIATDESSEALDLFSLEHPATAKEVKQRYRSLAMEHHPDRGGDPQVFQKVNRAFGVLQRIYR